MLIIAAMIVITGAYGFIGSCLVEEFNKLGKGREVVVVDDFYKDRKEANLEKKSVREWIHRDIFIDWFSKNAPQVSMVYHLGARTDTTEQDTQLFENLNVEYSKSIWNICVQYSIPLIYASSAATYGDGKLGFDDSDDLTASLKPLNPYGQSKLSFDQWALDQPDVPPMWIGLRFFNVYGPNEYHKNRMASVVYQCYRQVKRTGEMKLFKSHSQGYRDGEQLRDFIYVKDLLAIFIHLYEGPIKSGIYNLGTGQARTFQDLVAAVFDALSLKHNISYIDIPEDIRSAYQYYTQAKMSKLKAEIPNLKFTTLEQGVTDYVTAYLDDNFKIY